MKKAGLRHQLKTFLEECGAKHGDDAYFGAILWLSRATLAIIFCSKRDFCSCVF